MLLIECRDTDLKRVFPADPEKSTILRNVDDASLCSL